MRNRILRLSVGLLTAALLLSCLAAAWPRAHQEPENPISPQASPITPALASALRGEQEEATEPEETKPEETEPEESEPEETTPEETGPQTTQPQVAAPPISPTEPSGAADPTTAIPDPSGTPEPSPTDSPEPGTGPGAGDHPGGDEPQPGPSAEPEDSDPQIVTDLSNRIVTTGEVQNDTLPFYAYIQGGNSDLYLRVNLRNSETSGNGTYLSGQDGQYTAKLALGRNYLNLYIKEGNRTIAQASFVITYAAEKADENNPVVGDNPPAIQTNLDGWTEDIKTQNFTLTVIARDSQQKPIYASGVSVTLDGAPVTGPTGSSTLEYVLYFRTPVVGDTERHIVRVTAWDSDGNSRCVSYEVTYRFVDEGQVNGTVRLVLDATTLGLGWLDDPYECEIRQGQPASYAVMEMLEEYGYSVDYGGSLDSDFYLRRVYRGDIARNAAVPEELWQKVQADGLNLTGQKSRDSIGEFDYTQGSGWMYSIGGVTYGTVGLSGYMPKDGDTIYLRFTLAYGKDIGGGGAGYGYLTTYCGTWLNGTYIESHNYDDGAIIQEATCTEAEIFAYTCTVKNCGHQKTEVRGNPLGHQEQETARVEPSETQDGYIDYTCQRCQQVRREILPKTGEGTAPSEPPTDPTEPPTDPTDPPTDPPEPPTDPPTDPTDPSEEPAPSSRTGNLHAGTFMHPCPSFARRGFPDAPPVRAFKFPTQRNSRTTCGMPSPPLRGTGPRFQRAIRKAAPWRWARRSAVPLSRKGEAIYKSGIKRGFNHV